MKRYSSREIIKILTDNGWYDVNCVGDHHQFKETLNNAKQSFRRFEERSKIRH